MGEHEGDESTCRATRDGSSGHDVDAGAAPGGQQAAARRRSGHARVQGLWALALAGWCATAAVGQRTSPHMKPLLGGHLYWEVDKDFLQGGSNRKVKFTLRTTFEADDDACEYNLDNVVSCQGAGSKTKPKNGVADVHGVLCVKMIRHHDSTDDPEIVTPHIKNPDDDSIGPCPYTWETLREETLAQSSDTIHPCESSEKDLIDNWNDGLKCYSNVHPGEAREARPAACRSAFLGVCVRAIGVNILSQPASTGSEWQRDH